MDHKHSKDVDALLATPLDELTDFLEEMCVTVGAQIIAQQAHQGTTYEIPSSRRLTQEVLVHLDEIRTVIMAISTKNAVDDVYQDMIERVAKAPDK